MRSKNMAVAYPFTLLDKRLQYWISKLGFSEPTEIQELSIEPILRGENVLLISPTGTGKTEAALFPLLHRLLREEKEEGIKLLYINPLKALTRDLAERLRTYAHFINLKVRPLYGDVSKAFKKPVPEIIIITPESLEIILDWAPRWWPYIKTIKYVIIDEVHELISSKRGYQLLVLLERLKQLVGRNLQRVCLSATIANAKLVAEIFGGSDGKLKVIRSSTEREHEFEVRLAIPLTREEKEDPFVAGARLVSEYIDNTKSLIFANSRYSAERLKAEIEKRGIKVGVHHGSIGLEEREFSEDAFKQGLIRAVIATKTLELGIDIGDVEQVIQYRSPGQVNALIQRAGRSLHRPGEKSVCKIISTDPEDFLECLALVSLFNKGFLEKPVILEKPLDVLAKETLGYALHNYRGVKSYKGWFKPVNLKSIYGTVKNCLLFKTLSEKEFEEVVSNLVASELLSLDDGIPFPGPRFWNVWRFEETEIAEWPSLNFSEFFSMIPKRETFTLWAEHGFGKRRKLGELDSSFVYKSLATGMVIRFAGSNWKVSEIDEKGHNVLVIEAKEAGEVPSWKGEGPQRSEMVAREMLTILRSLTRSPQIVSELAKDEKAVETIVEYVKSIESSYLDAIADGKFVVEYVPSLKTWIFITFLGENINRTLAAAIYEKISEVSLLVKYVISPIGFAFRSEVVNPLHALGEISLEEFEELVKKHVTEKSPFTRLIKDQMKEHFGFPKDEVLIEREASRQAMKIYYDVKGGIEAFKRIKSGCLVEVPREKTSQLGESIIRYPFERPWNVSLKSIIKETLEKFQFGTLDDIFEYTWSNPLEAKRELQELSREIDIIAFLDLTVKGWSIVKVPLEEKWATIKVPVATKFFIIRNEEDLEKIQRELAKEKFPLTKLLNLQIEFAFTRVGGGAEEPYRLKITNAFETVLDKLIKSRIEKNYDKVNLKVHISGTRITMIHYGVPAALLKYIIQKDVITSHNLLEKGIVSGRRQLIFEFP
ncbi:MAG: DEAD/DEAH box helicase [Candidatus Aenigmarchaeota archaeon]|nr:DEAD/DEAH box helicase [Candidatus Aenigmarchaeota archaeon]